MSDGATGYVFLLALMAAVALAVSRLFGGGDGEA